MTAVSWWWEVTQLKSRILVCTLVSVSVFAGEIIYTFVYSSLYAVILNYVLVHINFCRKKSSNVFDKTETREVTYERTTENCEHSEQLVHHTNIHVNTRRDLYNEMQDRPLNAIVSTGPQYFVLEDDKNASENVEFAGRMTWLKIDRRISVSRNV